MTKTTVKPQIPFELFLDAIANLPLEEKHQLWQLLNDEINQSERNFLPEDSYDWGSQGQPKGKPLEYIPGVGLKVVGGKNAPT
ncbi:hypothetical protein LC608_22465 [Nostoc sp. XA010]|uniref:hypothetical protein n=1 Tax=Nostoc sp. XA010 TaxID=2780407 RepID=UPI001E433847|nr:hypothetical protein [Nostoc sp. XA010]MCC5659684.1 hypothetical protein [Nostoc sp. XA010]